MLSSKKLKSAIGNNVENKDFFMSDVFKQHLESLTKMVSHRYGDAYIWLDISWGGENVAYTDNRKIFINLDNPIIKNVNDTNKRFLSYLGLLGHELGHVLYTNFSFMSSFENCPIDDSAFKPSEKKTIKEINAYKAKYNRFITSAAHHISNCVEDGYVNAKIKTVFPGTFNSGISYLHSLQFKEDAKPCGNSVTDILNAILVIAVRNDNLEWFDKYPCLKKVIRLCKGLTHLDNSRDRNVLSLSILCAVWPEIKKVINEAENEAESKGENAEDVSDSLQKDADNAQSGSQQGHGKGVVNETTGASSEFQNQGGTENNENNNKKGKTDSSTIPADNPQNQDNSMTNGNISTAEQKNKTSSRSSLSLEESTSNSNDFGLEDTEQTLSSLVSDYIKQRMKKDPKWGEKMLDDQTLRNITESECSPHKNIAYKLNQIAAYNSSSGIYNDYYNHLAGVSKRLQKRIMNMLELESEGQCKNLLMGNKINPAAAADNKGRIFKRNILPENASLAVSVLIDESGSMAGNRITKATEMAIVIEDFCRQLNIPLQIVGHRDNQTVELDNFIGFQDCDKNRKYKLTRIRAGGCNRDGLALRFCADKLLNVEADKKLLIIISDGLPNSNHYRGKLAEDDLFSAKVEFERRGGRLIAAAIGDDKETIRRIYKDSYLDISDISTLPMKMVSLIAKYLTA